MHFYETLPGLELGLLDKERRVAFYWLGKAMLGLWEKPTQLISPQHVAFSTSLETVLNQSAHVLQQRAIQPYNFLGEAGGQPMVLGWMPAVSIYFCDRDGHELEFIAMLPDPPRPDPGVVSYSFWNEQGV